MNNQVANSAGMAKEFMDFLKKFGVIGLAIGVVVGGAVKTLVDEIVANIVTPLINKIISLITGSKSLDLPNFGIPGLNIGALIGALITFIVLMWIVFVAVKVILSKFLSKEELEAMKM
jgi:large conductance mechanosensitive channel